MKQKLLTSIFALGTVFSLASCMKSPEASVLKTFKELRNPSNLNHSYSNDDVKDPEYLSFKDKMKAFATRLSESFAKREFAAKENIVISPLSIELCLGLSISASSGTTRQEMLDAIGVDFETFNKHYKLFFNETSFEAYSNTKMLQGQLLLSNSIWIDNDVKLKDSGLDNLNNDYYCYSYDVDFDGRNKDTNEAIREFIKDKTKGLIDQNLNLSPETLFTLMNTLYLKDIWNNEGDNLSYTKEGITFKNYDGNISHKKLLEGYYKDGRVLNREDFSAFHTITCNGIVINFIKPSEGKDIKDVFNKENIAMVLDSSNYQFVDNDKKEIYHTKTIFPEYSADINLNLIPMFKEDFNVKSLFSSECDLSNLTDDKVYCSEFKQIAKLKVDKKGIEGAAVTYQAYAGASAPDEEWKDVYETFIVDESFGYVVMRNNAILFSGIVTNID